ncbi:MAG TPA: hypothetical protein VFX49_21045, partial [Chloroflexota bacterium]|nr:hypothetical protein [Chloroflexota bacterium]
MTSMLSVERAGVGAGDASRGAPGVGAAPNGLHTARAGALSGEALAELAAGGTEWLDCRLSARLEQLLDGLNRRRHARFRVVGNLALTPPQLEEPIVVRRALAFALVLREMPIYIQDGELLAGGRTVYGPPRAEGSPVFPGLVGSSTVSYFPPYATPEEEAAAGMRGGAAS